MTVTDLQHWRRPTGVAPWPFILLEGEDKSGRTTTAALLSASEKVGRMFWIDIQEGSADEYGALPGVDYIVATHDGSDQQILQRVREAKTSAAGVPTGDPPTVLTIDNMSDFWGGIKDWLTGRATRSNANQRLLAHDPNAAVHVPNNLWNEGAARHDRLMKELLSFPGIVVVIARGKQVAEIGPEGNPIQGSYSWKVEGHKTLQERASVWIRMHREHPPQMIACRSATSGVMPGRQQPRRLPDPVDSEQPLLEHVIFDVLRCDPGSAHVRDYKTVQIGLTVDDAVRRATDDQATFTEIRELWRETAEAGLLDNEVTDEHGQPTTLGQLVKRRGDETRVRERGTDGGDGRSQPQPERDGGKEAA